MARRQRCGVQLPPSGKMASALPPSRLDREPADLVDVMQSPAARRRNALGTRLARMSMLGSSCSVAFMTTRGRRSHTLSR